MKVKIYLLTFCHTTQIINRLIEHIFVFYETILSIYWLISKKGLLQHIHTLSSICIYNIERYFLSPRLDEIVSIIIATYNGKKYLDKCLDSLKNTKYSNFEILVIDNNSSDGSAALVKQNYPYVKLIELLIDVNKKFLK